jgi:hypothetical protein
MKISELPRELREKALRYQKADVCNKETDNIGFAFNWGDTKEGYAYWKELHHADPDKKIVDNRVFSYDDMVEAYNSGKNNEKFKYDDQ